MFPAWIAKCQTSVTPTSKLKLFKKKLRNTLVPSESEEEHDGEEIKSTSTKTSNTGKVVAAPHQKRKVVRSQQ